MARTASVTLVVAATQPDEGDGECGWRCLWGVGRKEAKTDQYLAA